MNGLKTCTRDSTESFISWFLSVEKAPKLRGNDPKDICLAKAERNYFKLLHFLPSKKFWLNFLREKMRADVSKVETASHISLTLTNCKLHNDENLTSFIYRWGDFCYIDVTRQQNCRGKLKIDLFSS